MDGRVDKGPDYLAGWFEDKSWEYYSLVVKARCDALRWGTSTDTGIT